MKRNVNETLLGTAVVLMVVSSTAQWWLDSAPGDGRYALFHETGVVGASLFLVLIGFSLGQSYARRAGEEPGVSAWRTIRHGAALVAGGAALEVLVLPGGAPLSAGLLPAMGVGTIVAALSRRALGPPLGRIGLLALAVASYLTFALMAPALGAWAPLHRALARVVFVEFPPWPWAGLVVVGLVLGWLAVGEAMMRRRRYSAVLAILGAVMVLGALERTWSLTPATLYFEREVFLNGHWTPPPEGAVGALGIVLLALAAAHAATLRGRWPALLVVIGRAALPLYVVQQIVVPTLAHPARATILNDWSRYLLATGLLLVVLLTLGHAWRLVRWMRRAAGPRRVAPGGRRAAPGAPSRRRWAA